MEFLNSFDQLVFKTINQTLSNGLFDLFFPTYTNFHRQPWFLLGIFPILMIFFIRNQKLRALFVTVTAWLATQAIDAINDQLLKPWVARPRPFKDEMLHAVVRISEPGSFSFPSGHATDAFCLAVFFSLLYPKKAWIFFIMAFLTCYSRVYCGVHYPGDVLSGAVVGSLGGYLGFRIFIFAETYLKKRTTKVSQS